MLSQPLLQQLSLNPKEHKGVLPQTELSGNKTFELRSK